MLIKICGLTRRSDAEFAASEGAELLGFVVHPPSPRHCPDLGEASRGLGERGVLVMVSEDPELLARTADQAGLRWIQPYVPPELRAPVTADLKARGFSVLLPWPDEDADPARTPAYPDLFLWENSPRDTGVEGGSGRTHGMRHPPPSPFLLAGGLGPGNVHDRFKALPSSLRPALRGFDAASRLETSPGVKDPLLVRAFIQAARRLPEESDHAL